MRRWIPLAGLFYIYMAHGIFANELQHNKGIGNTDAPSPPLDNSKNDLNSNVLTFVKASDRTVRSTIPTCQNSSNTIEVTYGDDATIECSCKEPGVIKWFDAFCKEVTPSSRFSSDDVRLTIKAYNKSDSPAYECRRFNDSSSQLPFCTSRTQIFAKEKVESGNNATAGIIICIVLAAVFVISLCCIRKYKTTMSLCLRDTCTSNQSDGKEYDAYVSMGVAETDRKFVEGFVREILMKKYNYNLIIDDKNLLPRLDYSNKLQANLHKCRRLVVIFSASYMTHDWCMYCFNEGLRKIADLHVPTIFVVTDHTIQSELRSHIDVITHIPQILLAQYQTTTERRQAIDRVRQRLPPPSRIKAHSRKNVGMKSPMLSDTESIHKSDVNFNNGTATYTEQGTEYRFEPPSDDHEDNVSMEYDEEQMESERPDEFVTAVQIGEEIDPSKVKVHQYGARKDFYNLTMSDGDT